eukprot:7379996-Prymnesium_polylepis.1
MREDVATPLRDAQREPQLHLGLEDARRARHASLAQAGGDAMEPVRQQLRPLARFDPLRPRVVAVRALARQRLLECERVEDEGALARQRAAHTVAGGGMPTADQQRASGPRCARSSRGVGGQGIAGQRGVCAVAEWFETLSPSLCSHSQDVGADRRHVVELLDDALHRLLHHLAHDLLQHVPEELRVHAGVPRRARRLALGGAQRGDDAQGRRVAQRHLHSRAPAQMLKVLGLEHLARLQQRRPSVGRRLGAIRQQAHDGGRRALDKVIHLLDTLPADTRHIPGCGMDAYVSMDTYAIL